MKNVKFIIYLFCLSVLFSGNVLACSVPVFRYALERWQPDDYRAVVVYNKVLSSNEQEVVDYLTSESRYEDGSLNLRTHTADTSSDEENELIAFAKKHQKKDPSICLLYPFYSGINEPIWVGDLTMENAKSLTGSDFMQEVSAEILRGETAVWVFLESGDKAKDDELYEVLERTLENVREEVELPVGIATPDGEITGGEGEQLTDPSNQLHGMVPLKISFSILRLSRDSKKEQILLASLLNLEQGLAEIEDEVMVFPVFGQGRVLPPLIGKGVNEENVYEYAYYLCAPCSCQVKAQNPGIDLLVARNWFAYLEGSEAIEEKELPPLSGVADITEEAPDAEQVEKLDVGNSELDKGLSRVLKYSLGLGVIMLFAGVIVGSVLLRKKNG